MHERIMSILPAAKPARTRLALAAACSLLAAAAMAAAPYLAGKTLDLGILSHDGGAFLKGSLLAAAAVVLAEAFGAAAGIIQSSARVRICFELGRRMFSARLGRPYSTELEEPGAEYSVVMHAERTASFIADMLPSSLLSCVKGLLAIGMAFWIDWRPALAATAAGLLIYLSARTASRKSGAAANEATEAAQKLFSRCADLLGGAKVIKALGIERRAARLFTRPAAQFARAQSRFGTKAYAAGLVPQWLGRAATGAIAIYCGWLAVRGQITPGQSAAAIFYITQAAALPEGLSALAQHASEMGPSLDEAAAAMRHASHIRQRQALAGGKVSLKATALEFAYGKTGVFSGLDFDTGEVKRIRISGPSGCGKTTLLHLIAGLYQPDGGEIEISGTNPQNARGIALCPQQPELFDMPPLENIRLASAGISAEEKAVKASGVDHAMLAHASARELSQGQQQRISLARALAAEPALLLLDESFSGLQPQAEAEILASLSALYHDMAVVYVSHREQPAFAEEARLSLLSAAQ